MQIGEQGVAGLEPGDLLGLGFLDLDDHLGRIEHRLGPLDDLGAGGAVGLVGDVHARARARLDEDLVALVGERMDHAGGQADPALLALDLLGHADAHGCCLLQGCASLSSPLPPPCLALRRARGRTARGGIRPPWRDGARRDPSSPWPRRGRA